MSDAFWANLGNIITALGVVYLGYLGRKINTVGKAVDDSAVMRTKQIAEVAEAVKEAKEATVTLQEGQTVLARSLETNTFDTNAIKEAMAGYIAGNSKPGALQ